MPNTDGYGPHALRRYAEAILNANTGDEETLVQLYDTGGAWFPKPPAGQYAAKRKPSTKQLEDAHRLIVSDYLPAFRAGVESLQVFAASEPPAAYDVPKDAREVLNVLWWRGPLAEFAPRQGLRSHTYQQTDPRFPVALCFAAEVILHAWHGLHGGEGPYRLGKCEWQGCRKGPEGGRGWYIADRRQATERTFCSGGCAVMERRRRSKEDVVE